MRKRIGCIIVAALMAAATVAAAQDEQRSIGKAREYCAEWEQTDFSKIERPFYAGYCLGLFQAFRDGMTIGMASTLTHFKEKVTYTGPDQRTGYEQWCIPADVTNQHLAGVFMAWSSRNTNYWHLPYSIGFFEAFKEEWPCPDGGAPEKPPLRNGAEGPAAGK